MDEFGNLHRGRGRGPGGGQFEPRAATPPRAQLEDAERDLLQTKFTALWSQLRGVKATAAE